MKIEIVKDLTGFNSLQADWERLSIASNDSSVFMSWDWQSLWWKYYGKGQPLFIVVAREASTNRVVGILPLYVQKARVFKFIPVRFLRPVGTGGDTSPDDLNPLIEPGLEDAVSTALAEAVCQRTSGWDMLHISDLKEGSAFTHKLQQACEPKYWRTQLQRSALISFAPLADNWDDYLKTTSSNHRETTRRARRKFESLPGTKHFVWGDSATIDTATDKLIELHLMRWDDRSGHHAFSTPEYVGFHKDVIRALHPKGHVWLSCLQMDEQIVGIYYIYHFRDVAYYFQGGFNPEYAKHKPGAVLMGYSIHHAINQQTKVFDMLRGEYSYKNSWAKQFRQTFAVDVARFTPGSLAHVLRYETLPRLKRQLKARFASNQPAANEAAEKENETC
jgi:CelD/BcsL family acetyltransferase involved in cellulose biosynthesis